jgi:16S rRNA (uracil1498-N3)-methyltransferase
VVPSSDDGPVSLQPFVHVDVSLVGRRRADVLPLSDAERHHLVTVLRLRNGAAVVAADGVAASAPATLDGEHLCLLADAVEVVPARPVLAVAQAIGKGRKVDDVVRVCTELGVDEITVVAAARSISRLDGTKAERARDRWGAVARAASEQSRRVVRPAVRGPVPTRQVSHGAGSVLIAHPGGTALPSVLGGLADTDRLTLVVGPEGGWSDEELTGLVAAGGTVVGLGPAVLRTEHAAAAGLAVLGAVLGRWGDGPGADA